MMGLKTMFCENVEYTVHNGGIWYGEYSNVGNKVLVL